ncbi:hypothetical protein ANCDUO_16492 [Ancylostoma duodenale]|uniref:Uncharacterized protein n=1 Tax=Ancylostoma duodenale TaxID=51022 RepID=A0A0C2CAS3_9BILA|nr:hypothetical protein ANCDUO_16492 [Ancylostoma duodenale]
MTSSRCTKPSAPGFGGVQARRDGHHYERVLTRKTKPEPATHLIRIDFPPPHIDLILSRFTCKMTVGFGDLYPQGDMEYMLASIGEC